MLTSLAKSSSLLESPHSLSYEATRFTKVGSSSMPALALVEQDHGHALARDVAKRMVLFLRRSGNQAQFSAALRHDTCDRATIWESVIGTHLKDCVDETQFRRVHAGE